jgi:hypothetical protein
MAWGLKLPTDALGSHRRKAGQSSSLWDDYVAIEELAQPKGAGGRPPKEVLLKEIFLPCYRKGDPQRKPLVRCIGMKTGCQRVWAGWPVPSRLLAHVSDCSHLPEDIRSAINAKRVQEAPLAKVLQVAVASASNNLLKWPCSDPEPSSASQANSTKKIKLSTQPSVEALSRKAKINEITKILDLDVLKFVCVSGILLRVVDLPQWRTLWVHANPLYTPASATKLADVQIPQEVSFVRNQQLEILKQEKNLTLTFDGNTTCLPESVYTIHIITPDHQVYFFEGNEASNKSHTSEHLYDVMKKVSCLVPHTDY